MEEKQKTQKKDRPSEVSLMEEKQKTQKKDEGITTKQKPHQVSSKTEDERIVRILSKDIEGKIKVYSGLTKIKGISWTMSNAICKTLKIDKKRKIGSLTGEEIKKISEFSKNPKMPGYLVNRQKDFETGENKHFIGSDLELRTEFDIKRLKKIKCYRGARHSSGLPLRGQRTRSHFRKNRKKAGGIKVKKKPGVKK